MASNRGGRPKIVNQLDPELDELIQRVSERVQEEWERELNRLLGRWDQITNEQRTEIVRQIEELINEDNIDGLATLHVPTEAAADLLAGHMENMAETGANGIASEAAHQDTEVEPQIPAAGVLAAVAGVVVAGLAAGLASAAASEALRVVRPDSQGMEVARHVDEYIRGLRDRALRDQLGGALTNAQNKGRFETMLAAPPAAWYASERNDPNACDPCRKIDDHKFDSLGEAMLAYPNGGYVNCEGGIRCRGTIVPVWGGED